MIQYYLDLLKQVQDFKKNCNPGGQIQKIYSTVSYISISIRNPGKTWHLFLGRGNGAEGVWTHHSIPPKELRRKDSFLDYLRRHLIASTFLGLSLDSSDRIIKLDYQKFGEVNSFLFFWKGRKLYFAHFFKAENSLGHKLLLSWNGKTVDLKEEVYNLFELFNEVGRSGQVIGSKESNKILTIDELLDHSIKGTQARSKKKKFLTKKIENIHDDLRKAAQWRDIQSFLSRSVNLEKISELKIGDHAFNFEGAVTDFQKRDALFEKIKKLKKGEKILEQRLSCTEKELSETMDSYAPISDKDVPVVAPVWLKVDQKKMKVESISFTFEFKIFQIDRLGLTVGVGLSAKGNDQLRNSWASKDDYWLHLDGMTSSHVVIKLKNNNSLTPDVLNLGASILAFFSGFKSEWIPIIYAQVKNLRGVSGKPGMVTYKKQKHLRCFQQSLKEIDSEYP